VLTVAVAAWFTQVERAFVDVPGSGIVSHRRGSSVRGCHSSRSPDLNTGPECSQKCDAARRLGRFHWCRITRAGLRGGTGEWRLRNWHGCSAAFSPEKSPLISRVQQVTKLEFVIILKTAKTLGLNIPSDVLSIADTVIE
jgi:hypothetical protein